MDRPVRAQILDGLKPRVKRLARRPGLAVVLVGDDPALRSICSQQNQGLRRAGHL